MNTSETALTLHEIWNRMIETTAKCPICSREDLTPAYTPGIAKPCKIIATNKDAAYQYTLKANPIAVVSDEMKLAASEAIARLVPDDELTDAHIMPEAFDPRVAEAVSDAVTCHIL